jgi:hypothetical protein
VDEARKRLGRCGALASGCVWREGRRGAGAWSIGPPDMDEEIDHHESDHEEVVKHDVRYHDAVSFHGAKRRLLYRIHLLSNYPSSTGTGPNFVQSVLGTKHPLSISFVCLNQ